MLSQKRSNRNFFLITLNNFSKKNLKRILICFDSASQRVQPTVPTFFLPSDTDQSNNTQIMRTGNNNDSITIINNNNNNNNNNIYDNNRSNWPFLGVVRMEVYHE